MNDVASLKSDYEALNNLIVNSPEFEDLERMLGGFNLFQVLKFEYGEIRHSNVLGWILDPSESHGLDELFLKKWLMRVLHEAEEPQTSVSAVRIDSWQLLDVEVRREWRHIDLLLVLRFAGEDPWVVAIENKVNSSQHSDQLSRYRQTVENEFPDAGELLYLFLTKNSESADDAAYIPASYAQIHRVLKECVAARSHLIGTEPTTLLENYLRLLEEKFMDENEIARIARKIYKEHKRALDVIYSHRPDHIQLLTKSVEECLIEKSGKLGIQMAPVSKGFVRFIPSSWSHPGNQHGTGWSNDWKGTVLFEINLRGKNPKLYVISGKAPDSWADRIWTKVQSPGSPFVRNRTATKRPKEWISLHYAGAAKIDLDAVDAEDMGGLHEEIVAWCAKLLAQEKTLKVIQSVAAELPALDDHYRSQVS
ncbi:PD-(D/E)XK nuclease family protein [Luteolibacter marinus]|uniref:PDDEXK-like family protein n=1 Tax=Luteolibacter marinus TaxID=2776705 RepID=UPI001866C5ED|nr:PD-(D/E)XK nuclease family protein [Luteolibacter marinus]